MNFLENYMKLILTNILFNLLEDVEKSVLVP